MSQLHVISILSGSLG